MDILCAVRSLDDNLSNGKDMGPRINRALRYTNNGCL